MLKTVRLFALLLLCVYSTCAYSQPQLNRRIVNRMMIFDLASAQKDVSSWALAVVELDDPKTYNFYEPETEKSGFIVKKGQILISHKLKGDFDKKSIAFKVKQAAAKMGDSIVSSPLAVDQYDDFSQGALILCRIKEVGNVYAVDSALPIPKEWSGYFVDAFQQKEVNQGNPLKSLLYLKEANWHDPFWATDTLNVFEKSLNSKDYWEVAYSVGIAFQEVAVQANLVGTSEKSIEEQQIVSQNAEYDHYDQLVKLIKSNIENGSLNNADGLVLAIDVLLLRVRASSNPIYGKLSVQLMSLLPLIADSNQKENLSKDSLNVIERYRRK